MSEVQYTQSRQSLLGGDGTICFYNMCPIPNDFFPHSDEIGAMKLGRVLLSCNVLKIFEYILEFYA